VRKKLGVVVPCPASAILASATSKYRPTRAISSRLQPHGSYGRISRRCAKRRKIVLVEGVSGNQMFRIDHQFSLGCTISPASFQTSPIRSLAITASWILDSGISNS
jgi:hypothetical protein